MPLNPISFSTIEDVYKLLYRLRDKGLLRLSKDEDFINATSKDVDILAQHFVIGSDFQTYLLDDLMDLNLKELEELNLTFITKRDPQSEQLSETSIPATERMRLWDKNHLLLHNTPLVSALVKFNPTPNRWFDLSHLQCRITKKPIVFPVLTVKEETIEGLEAVKKLLDVASLSKSSNDGYVATLRSYIPNRALADLQIINCNKLHEYLSQLPNNEAATAKANELKTNLMRVNSLLIEFCAQHPQDNVVTFEDPRIDNERLLQQMFDYKLNKFETELDIDNRNKIYQNKKSDAIFWVSAGPLLAFTTILGIPLIPLIIIPPIIDLTDKLPKYKKRIKSLQKDLENMQTSNPIEDFRRDQLNRSYLTIIKNSFELIDTLKRLLPATPLAPLQRSASTLRNLSLLARAPALTRESSELSVNFQPSRNGY